MLFVFGLGQSSGLWHFFAYISFSNKICLNYFFNYLNIDLISNAIFLFINLKLLCKDIVTKYFWLYYTSIIIGKEYTFGKSYYNVKISFCVKRLLSNNNANALNESSRCISNIFKNHFLVGPISFDL